MKFSRPIPIQELAQKYELKVVGNELQKAYGINEIHKVEAGDITFVDVEKYYEKSISSATSIILINKETACPEGKTLLICERPFEVYNTIVQEHRPWQALTGAIHATAWVHPSVILEPGVIVGPYAVVDEGSILHANSYIGEYSVLGKRVTIQAGALIGTDAFYYKKTAEGFVKWRSGGRVLIQDDVEIGAGCTINKGVSGDTIVGRGTKMDCQVHVGHGVVIGERCLFAAQVGIGGKTKIGNQVVLYGQVGVAQNIEIGDQAVILAKSGVSKSLEGGKTYFGAPAEEVRQKYKELAALRQLPDMMKGR